MRNSGKKPIAFMLSVIFCVLSFLPALGVSAKEMKEFNFTVKGYDTAAAYSGVTIYPAEADTERVIKAETYSLRYAKLLVFNKDGLLVEAGENLTANTDGTYGSPQTSVTIPAGGFMAAFCDGAPAELLQCYRYAFDGAMLYNATMTIIREIYGEYDKASNVFTIRYEEEEPASDSAIKFLFVGNSTTYFNGTPLKFKAMCKAAGTEVVADYCTFGSAKLTEFADASHERGKALRKALESKKYDYVVLQDSGGASYESGKSALDVIVPLVRANGAKPLLYMRYSSTSDKSARLNNAKLLYGNYSRFAELYDAVYAPVVTAFVNCTNDYPDIVLYGDDNSHHSVAGSYLIAATWMYAFLGVSPVGNSFTAYLPRDVVKALQEEAVKSVDLDDGTFGSAQRATYVYGGKTYVNVAFGRDYTPTGKAYGGEWTDTGSDGKPLGKLTDGVIANGGSDTSCGCYKGGTTYIIIDLGEVKTLRHMTTDLYGNSEWGIPDPAKAKVTFSFASEDKAFGTPVNAGGKDASDGGAWKKYDFSLTLDDELDARYVKIGYTIEGTFCWSSEIQVFGVNKTVTPPETSEEVSEEASEEVSEEVSSDTSSDTSSGEAPVPPVSSNGIHLLAAIIGAIIAAFFALFFVK